MPLVPMRLVPSPQRCRPSVRYSTSLAIASVVLAAVAALASTSAATAQWSSDPANNLVLSDRSGEQVQPKIIPAGDGAYVSWFDNADGGYDVYLQRLDAAGFEQWAHNGVLVLDRGFSSTQDYGLSIDTAGNALLVFRDDSAANVQITAAKVSPQGTLLWGASGVQLTATSQFVAAPKIVGTADGNSVAAWTQDTQTVAQKLDADGAPQWGAGVTLSAAGSLSLSDLQVAGSGTVMSFVQSAGGAGPRHLWAQKLDSSGALQWGAGHLQVYDDAAGSLQFGNFPTFIGDGSGGAVFSWYTSSPTLQVRAQRVDTAGNELFSHNGVVASTDASRNRVSPAVAYNASAQEVFLFWTETNNLQSQFGVYGQKLNAAGIRQWTDSGLEVVPLGANQTSFVQAQTLGDGARVAWIDSVSFANEPIRAARIDGAAGILWTTDLATAPTATSRLNSTSAAEAGLYVWSDGADANILAQNLNADGSLGQDAGLIFADGFESGDVGGWQLSSTLMP